jgi:hypothetical protein
MRLDRRHDTKVLRDRIATAMSAVLDSYQNDMDWAVILSIIAHTTDFGAHMAKGFDLPRKEYEAICRVCADAQWGSKS